MLFEHQPSVERWNRGRTNDGMKSKDETIFRIFVLSQELKRKVVEKFDLSTRFIHLPWDPGLSFD